VAEVEIMWHVSLPHGSGFVPGIPTKQGESNVQDEVNKKSGSTRDDHEVSEVR